MTESISNNAIIYATLALNSEVDLQREYLESDEKSHILDSRYNTNDT